MSVSSIMGQYESEKEASTTKKAETSDKEMFLKLLVAQLTYQDPLNPAEDTEFIAQLAQFTQVEELQNIRTSVDGMSSLVNRNQFISAVGLINGTVVAEGSTILKYYADLPTYDDDGKVIYEDDGTTAKLENQLYTDSAVYSTEYDVTSCTITVLDSSNTAVYTEEVGPRKAGQLYSFRWTGMDSYGQEVKDGSYTIAITGKDAGGNSRIFKTEISGRVSAVENIDGEYVLHLRDGRQVKYANLTMVQ
ncbi:MAG: hypothetical protein LBM64_02050 [Deltaproteobacteria bacterium]|jgi:flagellar basal-body rod modification protein FlgD|nr:hypothetical protein [Deltaproteobacteria bacterium]